MSFNLILMWCSRHYLWCHTSAEKAGSVCYCSYKSEWVNWCPWFDCSHCCRVERKALSFGFSPEGLPIVHVEFMQWVAISRTNVFMMERTDSRVAFSRSRHQQQSLYTHACIHTHTQILIFPINSWIYAGLYVKRALVTTAARYFYISIFSPWERHIVI